MPYWLKEGGALAVLVLEVELAMLDRDRKEVVTCVGLLARESLFRQGVRAGFEYRGWNCCRQVHRDVDRTEDETIFVVEEAW